MTGPGPHPSLSWPLATPGRLLATFFLTLAVPMGVLIGVVLARIQGTLESQATRQDALAARLAARLLHEHLEGSARYVGAHARAPVFARALATGDGATVRERLAEIVAEQTRFDRAFVTDAAGRLRYDYPVVARTHGHSFASRDWFQGVSTSGRPYVSAIYRRAAAPALYVVAIAAPIPGPDGAPAGYLVAQERAVELAAIAERARPTERTTVQWLDRAGATPTGPQGMPLGLTEMPGVRLALEGVEGTVRAPDPATQEDMITAYAPLPGLGGAVVVRQPAEEVFGPLDALRRQVVLLAALALSAMMVLGALVVRALERHQAHLVAVEAELRRSRDELEAVSYSLSHDLRTPLRGIDGFSQVLLEDQASRLDDAGRDHLMRVRQASQRMGHLLDDFVRLLSIGRAELRPEPLDVSALAREVVAELQAVHPDRRVECRVAADMRAVGDRKLVREVLAHLLGNAWKFTRDREQAHVAVQPHPAPAGQAGFVVEDDGVGFDMAYAARLFAPFERLHVQGWEDGSGMGLAIARRIVQRHGGTIRAEGHPGGGAKFCFTLPG